MNTHSGKNAIVMLIGLAAFAFLAISAVNAAPSKSGENNSLEKAAVVTESSSQIQLAATTEQKDKEYRIIPATSYADISVIEEAIEENGEVLGCEESDIGCVVGNSIKYQPLCTQSSATVPMWDGDEVGESGGGVEVTKNSKIEVWKVTAPLGFLSGSEYVEDSRMAIGNVEDGQQGTFKPAYNIILDDEARRFCTPGVNCEDFDKTIGNGPKGPYFVNVHAEMKGEEPTNYPDPDHAVIEPELHSVCPTVQESKPNPIKTNRKGEFIEGNFQLPGDHAYARSFSGVPCVNAKAGKVEEANGFISCLEKRTSFNFLIFATVAIQDWIDCTIGEYNKETKKWEKDRSACDTSVVTALKIDALFGSMYKCNKSNCASRYMDLTKLGTTIPGQAAAMAPEGFPLELKQPVIDDPVYLSTPCKIRVNGTRIYNIPCLWDVSVLERDYARQKAAAIPGDPNIPATFDEYWKMVEIQANSRKDACGVQ